MKSYKDKLMGDYVNNIKKHLDDNRCPRCGKKMRMQIDSITKKKSKYLWRCETCTPSGLVLSIG